MRFAPLTIHFMLHCYFSADPIKALGEEQWYSSMGLSTQAFLHKNGLITDDPHPKATERGKAWVEHICDTPLPTQEWIRGKRDD